jgi:hypothetical protein
MTTLELNTKFNQLKTGDKLTRYKGYIIINNTPISEKEIRLNATKEDGSEPFSVTGTMGLMAAMNEIFAKIDETEN